MFNQNTPASNLQSQGLSTIRIVIRALIRAGLSASLGLWPSPLPAQASATERSRAQTPQESISIELGKPIERELSGGLSHFYKITMISGQFLRISVKQQGIDVAVALLTPDGKKITEVDSDHLIEGAETASAPAHAHCWNC